MKILGYGVSVTTLEDVFMKVGRMDMKKKREDDGENDDEIMSMPSLNSE